MSKPSPFKYFKTSPEIIRLAVMMYVRFPLSLRNVEDLLHERGVDICHETVRFWWHRFGPMFAAEIRKRRIDGMKSSHWRWHLDEVFVKINGERHYLWRAVDHEGEVLESFVTKTRDKKAALKFLKKAMKKHGRCEQFVTDKLRSYGAALRDLGAADRQETGRWLNNRAENSHLPFRRRERAMLRFRRMRSLQKFASFHASVTNHFNSERSLSNRIHFKLNRAGALVEWQALCAAIKDSVIGLPDKGLTLSASTFPEPALPPYFARHKRCDTFSRGAYGGASMAWFSRFTRFGDVHLVFGQEARMSCGIASVLMCVFKINKLSINADALKKNTEIYALYSRISGGRYKPGEQGTHPHHLASVLNELDCGKWTGEYVSAEALSLLIHRNVGRSGGIGPVSKVNPVIAGVGWQGGGGHATVVDTIRTWNNEKFATVCDPWDANVHVVPFNETKPFSYNAGRGGFSVDFWGAHQGQKLPYPVTAVGGGIAAVYRI